jgi:outer membrane protein assembly factor BamD (BamD/ComL family)
VTKANTAGCSQRRRLSSVCLALLTGLLVAGTSGCQSENKLLTVFVPPWKMEKPDVKEFPKADSLVMRGNGLEKAEKIWHERQADIETGKQLIAEKQFAAGEKLFHKVGNDKKCPEQFREEGLFYEAECQRLQTHYRAAEETYSQLFKEHPTTQFTERADRGLFEISLHWLEPVRKQMEEYEEHREGKRWFVMPVSFVHFSSDMPIFDVEGHATRVLEGISIREKMLHTALGEQVLLYLGTLRFFREDYDDADRFFTDLFQLYPNSKYAAKALKQSVVCKQLRTGGTVYDQRTVEESRKLIHTAQTAYAEFAKDQEWIQKQLVGINLQQADRDWRIAEHYRWTKHHGSAYFYYELVRRCYPNTEYAAKAADRIREMEQRHPEAIQREQPGTPPPGGTSGGTPRLPFFQPAGTPPGGAGGPATPSGVTPPRILPPTLGQ